MKTLVFTVLLPSALLLVFSCEEKSPLDPQCVRGKVVGQKCYVFALQLEEEILGSTEWQKESSGDGVAETFANVIGLINLPDEYRVQDKVIYVSLRKPTNEESQIPCYQDMPNPPAPYYVGRNC